MAAYNRHRHVDLVFGQCSFVMVKVEVLVGFVRPSEAGPGEPIPR